MNRQRKKIQFKNIRKNNGNFKYMKLELFDEELTLNTLEKVQLFIKKVADFPRIYINLESMKLNQKLPINVLEWMLYNLIVHKNKNVLLDYNVNKTIYTDSFTSSPLVFLARNRNYDQNKFIQKFLFSSNRKQESTHYRRLVKYDQNPDNLNKLNSDIFLLFPEYVTEDVKSNVTQLITELAGNSLEHAHADCIVDLDITSKNYSYRQNIQKQNKHYFAINISIINYAQILLFTKIKNKVTNNLASISGRNEARYRFIHDAYSEHVKEFDESYSENNFWVLASIQHKISGRDFSSTGGTGLTTLVDALQEASELNNCYILTGSDVFVLKQEYMHHTKDMWLGFNKTNNFAIAPDKTIFKKSKLTFSGTAFNLSFVMEV